MDGWKMDPMDAFLVETIKLGWRTPGLDKILAARKAAGQAETAMSSAPPRWKTPKWERFTKGVQKGSAPEQASKQESPNGSGAMGALGRAVLSRFPSAQTPLGALRGASEAAVSGAARAIPRIARAAGRTVRGGRLAAEDILSKISRGIPPAARQAGALAGAVGRGLGSLGQRQAPAWTHYVEKRGEIVQKLSMGLKKRAPRKRLSAQVPPPPHTPASNAAFWSPDSLMSS